MTPRISALILIALCVIGILLTFTGCQSGTDRRTGTLAPTADTQGIANSVSDGKRAIAEAQDNARSTDGHLRTAKTRQQRIDYKAQLISEFFNQ